MSYNPGAAETGLTASVRKVKLVERGECAGKEGCDWLLSSGWWHCCESRRWCCMWWPWGWGRVLSSMSCWIKHSSRRMYTHWTAYQFATTQIPGVTSCNFLVNSTSQFIPSIYHFLSAVVLLAELLQILTVIYMLYANRYAIIFIRMKEIIGTGGFARLVQTKKHGGKYAQFTNVCITIDRQNTESSQVTTCHSSAGCSCWHSFSCLDHL